MRSFEGLERRAATTVVGGQSVLVAALDDIIKSKEAAGRTQRHGHPFERVGDVPVGLCGPKVEPHAEHRPGDVPHVVGDHMVPSLEHRPGLPTPAGDGAAP